MKVDCFENVIYLETNIRVSEELKILGVLDNENQKKIFQLLWVMYYLLYFVKPIISSRYPIFINPLKILFSGEKNY